jgi:hypothetical protein
MEVSICKINLNAQLYLINNYKIFVLKIYLKNNLSKISKTGEKSNMQINFIPEKSTSFHYL